MNLLTFDNPVFRYYAIAAALMIVKMMSQGWITIFRMITVKGGYRYPEDAQRSPPILIQARSNCCPTNMSSVPDACTETTSRIFHFSSSPGYFTSALRQATSLLSLFSPSTYSPVLPIFMSC